jgi:hypothetical protein
MALPLGGLAALSLLFSLAAGGGDTSDFVSFGIITDVHYADAAPSGTRIYRDSLPKVEAAVATMRLPLKSSNDTLDSGGDDELNPTVGPAAVGPPPPLPPWVPPPGGFPTNPCPCGELCKPLRRSALENRTKAQFFGFTATHIYNGSADAWMHWDWRTISTVLVWSTWHLPGANWGLLCRAHAEGVRVVVPLSGGAGAGYVTGSDNASARKQWITTQVAELTHFGLDGANFDVEGQYNASLKAALTSLICETRQAMHQYLPDATLTFDLSITPDNPTTRGGYDYPALAKCLDHIIPM